jgi:hypothetical protein
MRHDEASARIPTVMRPLDYSDHLGAPVAPPRSWFEPPDDLREDRFLTVLGDGRVYGRFYTRGVTLIVDDSTERAPSPSPTGYRLFHRQSVVTAEGDDLDVGAITVGGHNASELDDARNVLAVVRAGDDACGGWIAGALVPESTRADAAQLRRSQLSGHWIPMGDAYFASHAAEVGTGLELFGLAAAVTGRAVLVRRYKGWSATVHRASVDEIEAREASFDRELRRILDDHEPHVAVDIIRHGLDQARGRSFLRRRAEVLADEVALPRERIPTPFAS